jgi:hypothetical protein
VSTTNTSECTITGRTTQTLKLAWTVITIMGRFKPGLINSTHDKIGYSSGYVVGVHDCGVIIGVIRCDDIRGFPNSWCYSSRVRVCLSFLVTIQKIWVAQIRRVLYI